MLSDHSQVLIGPIGDEQALRSRLGARLRSLRKQRGLTMMVLANRAQCSQSLLSKVETGNLLPSLPMLQRLSRALESDMSFFLEG
jgi:transcriptional regulator with XRE-family HTH domain